MPIGVRERGGRWSSRSRKPDVAPPYHAEHLPHPPLPRTEPQPYEALAEHLITPEINKKEKQRNNRSNKYLSNDAVILILAAMMFTMMAMVAMAIVAMVATSLHYLTSTFSPLFMRLLSR